MIIFWEIARAFISPDVVIGGLILAGIMWTQPTKWAWRILAFFILWDCGILATHWPAVIRSPNGYPAPEDMGMIQQADATHAGVQLGAAIFIASMAYLALKARWNRHPDEIA